MSDTKKGGGKAGTTPHEGSTVPELAVFWGVQGRVMYKLLERDPPAPARDVEAMIEWFGKLPGDTQRLMSAGLRRKIAELRGGAGTPENPGSDYAKFKEQYDPVTARDTNALEEMKRQRDFALFKVDLAQQRNDFASVQDATKQLTHFSAVIHDEEVRANRLGREAGELIQRADVVKVARAIPFWMLRAVDELLGELCPRIASASSRGALAPDTVRALIEPELLAARVLEPFARAAQVNTASKLPDWFVDAMRGGLADALEDGEKVFDEIYRDKSSAAVSKSA